MILEEEELQLLAFIQRNLLGLAFVNCLSCRVSTGVESRHLICLLIEHIQVLASDRLMLFQPLLPSQVGNSILLSLSDVIC